MRGGEKCLEAFCEMFPEADLFTLLHIPGQVSPTIERHHITTSFLQGFPGVRRWYRYYLPLMPAAIEALDLSSYDMVLSSSHCVAKGIIPRPDTLHVSYVHTPMRYAWDLWPQYFPVQRRLNRVVVPLVLNALRAWDSAATNRVDHFVANSQFVAQRIAKYYRRQSTVIHPPVDTGFFTPGLESSDFYLMVTALVPYKGVELAIEAFNVLQRPLKIIGRGPLAKTLQRLAGPTVEFLGWRSGDELREYYAACRALVFPGQEDFGIVPLEANAAGRPVIALGLGGALETVVPANHLTYDLKAPMELHPDCALSHETGYRPTGVLFTERTPTALQMAVRFFETHEACFISEALRQHALPFGRQRFKARMQQFLTMLLAAHESGAPAPGI